MCVRGESANLAQPTVGRTKTKRGFLVDLALVGLTKARGFEEPSIWVDKAPSRARNSSKDGGQADPNADNVLLAACLCRIQQRSVLRDGLELVWINLVRTMPTLERPLFYIVWRLESKMNYSVNLGRCQCAQGEPNRIVQDRQQVIKDLPTVRRTAGAGSNPPTAQRISYNAKW